MIFKRLLIFLAFPITVLAAILIYTNSATLGEQPGVKKQQSQSTESTQSLADQAKQITGKDFITLFTEVINQKNIPLALGMLEPNLVPDKESQTQWSSQFNNLKQIKVIAVEESNTSLWTKTQETYKVTLDVEISPEAVNEPIPNFGWTNGSNIRWITTVKGVDELWRIAGISTGP